MSKADKKFNLILEGKVAGSATLTETSEPIGEANKKSDNWVDTPESKEFFCDKGESDEKI